MISHEVQELLDRTFPVIRDFAQSLRQSLFQSSRHVSASAGASLFESGDRCGGFLLLLSGSVRIVKTSVEGRQMSLYRIEPGQFCLMTSSCLLGRTAYTAAGIAVTKCEVVVVSPACFDLLVQENTGFRVAVFRLFSERLADLMQLVEEVAFHRLDQRLARLLSTRGPEIRTSHQSLADELGSVRVIVSRVLGSFEDRGWLSLEREHIRILNPDAIRRLASGSI